MNRVRFSVPLTPVPKGSMRAFVPRSRDGAFVLGRGTQPVVNMVADNKKALDSWVKTVATVARSAMRGQPAFARHQPLWVRLTFRFLRPKSVSVSERPSHVVKPDVDKLTRAIFDAVKEICWADDAQVVGVVAVKAYGEPGVDVEIVDCLGGG